MDDAPSWRPRARRAMRALLPRLGARSNAVPEQREQSVLANALVASSEGAEISLSNRHLCGVDCFGEPPQAYSVSVLPALAALIDRTASLTALDLSRNRLGDAGALLVAAAIEAHPRLRCVNLAANAIGCEGSRALAGALLRSGSVTTANLLRNHWDEESAAALAAVAAQRAGLRSLCGLGLSEQTLTLEHEGLEPRDAQLLAADCRSHGSLTALHLYDNRLGAAGVGVLAAAVAASGTVSMLDLSSNLIGGADDPARLVFVPCATGTAALAAALAGATALRSLVLYDNALGPKGGALLAAALRRESSLTLLDLRLNQLCGVDSFGNGEFTCEAVRSLANALDANETLSWLRLEHNAVPRHAAGWMRDAGRRRPGLRVSL